VGIHEHGAEENILDMKWKYQVGGENSLMKIFIINQGG
jgi:hypothetical protein